MSRKIPLAILISILIPACIKLNVSATESGPWSFKEMRTFSETVESLREAQCINSGDPISCYFSYQYEEHAEQFDAFASYNTNNFKLTAVNPSAKTMRVFFDSAFLMDKYMGVTPYEHDLTDFIAVQFDAGHGNTSYVKIVKNGGEPTDFHVLYTGFQAANGDKWFPSNQEVELPIEGFATSPDRDPRLFIMYSSTYGVAHYLKYDLSSCINSPDYRDGMECQIRYHDSTTEPTYVPVDTRENQVEPDSSEGNATTLSASLVSEEHEEEILPFIIPKAPETGRK